MPRSPYNVYVSLPTCLVSQITAAVWRVTLGVSSNLGNMRTSCEPWQLRRPLAASLSNHIKSSTTTTPTNHTPPPAASLPDTTRSRLDENACVRIDATLPQLRGITVRHDSSTSPSHLHRDEKGISQALHNACKQSYKTPHPPLLLCYMSQHK